MAGLPAGPALRRRSVPGGGNRPRSFQLWAAQLWQPNYGQGGYARPDYAPPPLPLGGVQGGPGFGGSGFLRSAATTAAGVAGGALLFEGIQSMFGHHADGILSGVPQQPAITETVINNYYGDDPGEPQDYGAAGRG